MIEGLSGVGKSTALRTLPPDRTVIITPNSKPLPWKGGDASYGKRKQFAQTLEELPLKIQGLHDKNGPGKMDYLVIEDFSHYIAERIGSKSFAGQNSGNAAFARYDALARDVMDAVFNKAKTLRPELKIILIQHTEFDNNSGRYTFKKSGKLLGDKLDPVSYMRIVLHARALGGKENPAERYVFQTQDDGVYEAKSPMGMFEQMFIPNDMMAVMKAVEDYDAPTTSTSKNNQ